MNGTSVSADKLNEFEILFDDPKGVYTSGDEITGKIRISLKEPVKMHMVRLRFIGSTRVTLSDLKAASLLAQKSKAAKKGSDKSSKDKSAGVEKQPLLPPPAKKQDKKSKSSKKKEHDVEGVIVGKNGLVAVAVPAGGTAQNSSSQNVAPIVGRYHEMISLDKTIDLLERRPGQEVPHDFILPAGLNTLPFSFLLPKKPLPASFESPFAAVRYVCQATICRPWEHDFLTKKAFTVLPPVHTESCVTDSPNSKSSLSDSESLAVSGYCCRLATASNFPTLSGRFSADETTSGRTCCCTTTKLTCEASIPKQVYNLGEPVTVQAKLTNGGRKKIDEVKFALVQTITCKGRDAGGKVERSSVYTRPVWQEVKSLKLPSSKSGKKDSAAGSKKQTSSQSKTAGVHDLEVHFRVPTVSPSMEIDSNVYNLYKSASNTVVVDQTTTLDSRKKSNVAGGLVMLRVTYHAVIEAKLGKKNHFLNLKLPVVLIGAPFVTFAQQEYDHKSPGAEPFELSECFFGPVDVRDETDDQYVRNTASYVPMYPVLRPTGRSEA